MKGPALWSVVREIEIKTKPSTPFSHPPTHIEHQQVRPCAVALQPCPPHLARPLRSSSMASLDGGRLRRVARTHSDSDSDSDISISCIARADQMPKAVVRRRRPGPLPPQGQPPPPPPPPPCLSQLPHDLLTQMTSFLLQEELGSLMSVCKAVDAAITRGVQTLVLKESQLGGSSSDVSFYL